MALNSLFCADVPLSNYSLTRLFTYTTDSGMGGILHTLTRPSGSGDLLAGSMGWLRRERDDRCLSIRRPFSFAIIDPGSERFPFSSVSGVFDLAVGTICESPRTGSRTSC